MSTSRGIRPNYLRELVCDQRLAADKVSKIGSFNVPRFIDHDDDLLVVEMDTVNPPYVLDFGKAYLRSHPLDCPHSYTDEEISRFLEEARENWEEGEWPLVLALINDLDDYGIVYLDVKPANINVGGLAR